MSFCRRIERSSIRMESVQLFQELDTGRRWRRDGESRGLEFARTLVDPERMDRIALLVFSQQEITLGGDTKIARGFATGWRMSDRC